VCQAGWGIDLFLDKALENFKKSWEKKKK